MYRPPKTISFSKKHFVLQRYWNQCFSIPFEQKGMALRKWKYCANGALKHRLIASSSSVYAREGGASRSPRDNQSNGEIAIKPYNISQPFSHARRGEGSTSRSNYTSRMTEVSANRGHKHLLISSRNTSYRQLFTSSANGRIQTAHKSQAYN